MRNNVPLVSFTFDDFPRSALVVGGAILKRFGLTGTYYASFGLMGRNAPTGAIFRAEDLKELAAQGHELGCHTFAHCHAWETQPAVFEESIIQNKNALAAQSRGGRFRTFSYPICAPRPQNKRIVGRHFACARGGGQTLNAGTVDLNQLCAYFLEQSRGDLDSVESLIESTCRSRGWLIFATHDVCAAPTPFGCTLEFFEQVVRCASASGATVLPVARALEVVAGSGAASH